MLFFPLTDVEIEIPGSTKNPRVDISYGGAFYALVRDSDIGLDVNRSSTNQIVQMATLVSGWLEITMFLNCDYNSNIYIMFPTIS